MSVHFRSEGGRDSPAATELALPDHAVRPRSNVTHQSAGLDCARNRAHTHVSDQLVHHREYLRLCSGTCPVHCSGALDRTVVFIALLWWYRCSFAPNTCYCTPCTVK
jgi:hypothetical protein